MTAIFQLSIRACFVPPHNIEKIFPTPGSRSIFTDACRKLSFRNFTKHRPQVLFWAMNPKNFALAAMQGLWKAAACACPRYMPAQTRAARNFLQGFCSCFSEIRQRSGFYRHLASTCCEKRILPRILDGAMRIRSIHSRTGWMPFTNG